MTEAIAIKVCGFKTGGIKLWALEVGDKDYDLNQYFAVLTADDAWLDSDLPWLGERFEKVKTK